MGLRQLAVRAALGLTIAALAGCASFRHTEPFPAEQKQVTVSLDKEPPSKWDLPLGIYAVPNTRLYISGHQAGLGVGMAFGLLGVIAADSINSARAQSRAGDTSAVTTYDMLTQADTLLQAKLKADENKALTVGSGGTHLSVQPFGVLTYVNDTEVRPYVVLKTKLVDTGGKPLWETQYIAASADVKPLSGDTGWLAQQAQPLRDMLQSTLDRSMTVMLRDVAGKNLRNPAKAVLVTGDYAYLQRKVIVKGNVVLDEPDYFAFTPKLGDVMVFSGVNIFERKSVDIREAKETDAVFAVVPLPKEEVKRIQGPAPTAPFKMQQ
ncbi:hypothetical protein [Ralstonia sp. NFACC01]|mgnify:CR=1 FL=1|uniref:hypothetical protein n=1 Tax=Ralstonia sp. NFACC01 TaxID=1566294 RepID=UPI0008E1BAB2|nr:hypothetical protein [Ralstonia sp. NFACC01]SFP99842.1 hypothetical protein SAMN03159417_03939 [Ralstonia sp. NFACC01]